MKDNTVLIYAVTLIGITLLSYILWNIDYSESSTEESIVENQFICGNMAFSKTSETELEQEGEILFKTNCAACHKTRRLMTGPALLKAIKNYPSDSSFISYLKRDKVVGEYGAPCISFPSLTYKNAEALRAYINLYNY